jgi:uncharacterized protein YidB (DUF937 family)
MGFLEEVTSQVVGATGGGQDHADMVGAAMNLLNQHGGVAGVAQMFQQNGLGQLVQSWVANGPNPAVTPAQVSQVFGAGKIGEIAQSLGVTPQAAAATLAATLPTLIDKLTPNGTTEGSLLQQGLGFLKKSGLFGS